MKSYEIPYSDKLIIRKFARACECSVYYFKVYPLDFIKVVLNDDIFDNFFNRLDIFSQSDIYVVRSFLESNQGNIPFECDVDFLDEDIEYFRKVAHWTGYLLMSWKRMKNINGKGILKYDLERIILSYPVLHTQSIDYAIDFIKKEYKVAEDPTPSQHNGNR